jgi:hypothetical protein
VTPKIWKFRERRKKMSRDEKVKGIYGVGVKKRER